MKPTELAKLLDVSPVTLRRWAGVEFSEFLSPTGAGQNGAHRSFSDQDSRILSLVAERKAKNASTDDIVVELRSLRSNDWRDLPPLQGLAGDDPVALVPREALSEYVRALRDRYESQLQTAQQQASELKTENAHLRQTMDELTKQVMDLNKRLMSLLEKERKQRK